MRETVRLWDPRTGVQLVVRHRGQVGAVCALDVGGRALLASGSLDGTVRVWDLVTGERLDLVTGELLAVLEGHQAVCAVDVDGRALLASGSADRTVRAWAPGPEPAS